MWTSPEFYIALFSGLTLIFYVGGVVVGATVFILHRLDAVKKEIMTDVNTKHESNHIRYEAMNTLVIRHETILSPEFNGHFHGR